MPPLAILFLTGGLLVPAPAVEAGSFSGANGRIAFTSAGEIATIRPDVDDRLNLTQTSVGTEKQPAWNAQATKLAFISDDHIVKTFDADGTNIRTIFVGDSFTGNPSWSADGSTLAFDQFISGQQGRRIFTVPASGGNATELSPLDAADPNYSPDGTRIAFESDSSIWVMNVDGSGAAPITAGEAGNAGDFDPSWSPDGTRIAFTRSGQIWTVDATGSGAGQLTFTPTDSSHPAWSPDGTQIAFVNGGDIWVINSNGDGMSRVAETPDVSDGDPDWGACTGNGCPPVVNAALDRSLPEPIEGETRVPLRVTLTKPVTQPVTVAFEYRDGTATRASGDYRATFVTGSVTIPAGQTSSGDLPYTFIREDGMEEPDENYSLFLTSATSLPIADRQTTIKILGIAPKCPGYEDVAGTHILGTDGDDVLQGTDEANVICGLGGDDRISDLQTNDIADGGQGKDTITGSEYGGSGATGSIHGGAGDDSLVGGGILYGDDGADSMLARGHGTLYGGNGNDRLFGDATNNRDIPDDLYGGPGNDFLSGHGGNDKLAGDEGDDRLFGGSEADVLDGGPGNDELRPGSNLVDVDCPDSFFDQTYVVTAGDDLRGGVGIDTVTYSDLAPQSLPAWALLDHIQVTLDDVPDDGGIGNFNSCAGDLRSEAIDNVHRDVEKLIGSRLPDWFTGSRSSNVLSGKGGPDRLFGGEGRLPDQLNGGSENDKLEGGAGDDKLNGEEGNDRLLGEGGDDKLNGGPGRDTCIGGEGRDVETACEAGRSQLTRYL